MMSCGIVGIGLSCFEIVGRWQVATVKARADIARFARVDAGKEVVYIELGNGGSCAIMFS